MSTAQSSGSRGAEQEEAGSKLKAGFRVQAGALLRKNLGQQRRAWKSNVALIATPFVFCVLLLVLQILIDKAFDTDQNKCGCACLRCCSTNTTTGVYACRDNSAAAPCQTWEDCQQYNTSQCGFQYSSNRQAAYCSIPNPSSWPALLQVANNANRARPWAPNAAFLFTGGANNASAAALAGAMFSPADAAQTAANQPAALQWLASGAVDGSGQPSDAIYMSALTLLNLTLGTWQKGYFLRYFLEPAFVKNNYDNEFYNANLFVMFNTTTNNATANQITSGLNSLSGLLASSTAAAGQFDSAQGGPTYSPVLASMAWAPNSSAINRILYCGYKQARCNGSSEINEVAQAYDFLSTNPATGRFSVNMWYNATDRFGDQGGAPPQIVRINQGMNRATNAFLNAALGTVNVTLVGMMDFPKQASKLSLDFSSLLGPLFFSWLLQLLLPLMLLTLVSEKEKRLRSMMKMHGLGDAAYWIIQYFYFLALNFVYTWVLIGFGSAINLSFFRRTQYSFQFVFYLLWNNCLVSFAFLLSTLFRSSKTAVVVAFLYVFATGLVGLLLLEQFVSQNHWWVVFLEIIPGFALYRGLYEIAQYAFRASYQNTMGLGWSNLGDSGNGVIAVMIIFAVEWFVFLVLAWYLEQVLNTGVGVPRHPLFFLGKRWGGGGRAGLPAGVAAADKGGKGEGGGVEVLVEPEDVRQERARVEALLAEGAESPFARPSEHHHHHPNHTNHHHGSPAGNGAAGAGGSSQRSIGGGLAASGSRRALAQGARGYSILVRDLWKIFPPMGGNSEKVAVRGLSLAIERGECFGLLGPNGAGKSTAINLLTGFLEPSAGTALVEGLNIRNEMGAIYSLMGVCPQHDLLWNDLTAAEHLRFYGRLKNLKGAELEGAIEDALRKVNLWSDGTREKLVGAFSGGMKRRLSVAISFMGNPLVVYLDEPSTGLDPASRHNLWDVVKQAKEDRGIILTTHSMEEASVLCDRLGIFVDGSLVCVGNPKELTARYAGYYVFTITAPLEQQQEVDELVRGLAPGARLTYSLAGTRKYELPADQVTLAGVFAGVEAARGRLDILDFGVSNATLEEVFIDLAKRLGVEGGN